MITVTREGGEVVYEATVRLIHPASKATHLDPPESAEYDIDECWRTVGDGFPVKLAPSNLPDDVYDEILTIASDPYPYDAEYERPEPDDVHAEFYDRR